MHPQLKENPRDWWKFLAGVCAAAGLIVYVMRRRGVIDVPVMWLLLAALMLLLIVAALRPASIRPLYRAGMILSFYIGQVVSRILLTLLFLCVVTPLGIVLRLFGKDLLALKRKPGVSSFWQPVKTRPD